MHPASFVQKSEPEMCRQKFSTNSARSRASVVQETEHQMCQVAEQKMRRKNRAINAQNIGH